jgi:hypothetical protein
MNLRPTGPADSTTGFTAYSAVVTDRTERAWQHRQENRLADPIRLGAALRPVLRRVRAVLARPRRPSPPPPNLARAGQS